MYWMLQTRSPENVKLAKIGKQPDLSALKEDLFWFAGKRFSERLPEPLRFEFDPFAGDVVPDFFAPPIPLMSAELLRVLQEGGVDSIESYSTVITKEDGSGARTDFRAVNILGIVKCADLEKSECDVEDADEPGGVTFDSLVIDELRARGSLFFRLFEAPQGIVVADSVKRKLELANLRGLAFVDPAEWSG
jgi:hypothetical protein